MIKKFKKKKTKHTIPPMAQARVSIDVKSFVGSTGAKPVVISSIPDWGKIN